METEELVRIAYLEPDYVPEAKALAVRELDKRGVPENRDRLIRQVRDENRERARAAKRQSARNVEQARALEFRFGAGMLIGLLWFAALLAPSMLKDMSSSENGTGLFLLGIWAIAVVDVRERPVMRDGAPQNGQLEGMLPSCHDTRRRLVADRGQGARRGQRAVTGRYCST